MPVPLLALAIVELCLLGNVCSCKFPTGSFADWIRCELSNPPGLITAARGCTSHNTLRPEIAGSRVLPPLEDYGILSQVPASSSFVATASTDRRSRISVEGPFTW